MTAQLSLLGEPPTAPGHRVRPARPAPAGSTATISADGLYRYDLTRPLVDPLPAEPRVVLVCGLNPSKASADIQDKTIEQCEFFGRREGGELLVMVNMHGFRATDPKDMWGVADPIGPGNDEAIRRWVARASLVIAAWGALPAKAQHRELDVLVQLRAGGREVLCFGTTADGFPRHPSRLAHATPLVVFERARRAAERGSRGAR
jgi:hypothetical protein